MASIWNSLIYMAALFRDEIQEQTICRLIRCVNTGRYFTGDDWSGDPSQAKVFRDEVDAVRACVEHDLTGVELVLRAPGSHADLFTTSIR